MADREPSFDQEKNQEHRRPRTLNLLKSIDSQPPIPSRGSSSSLSSPSSLPMVALSLSLGPTSPPPSQPLSQSQPTHPVEPPPKRQRNSTFPKETDVQGGVISGNNSQQQPHDLPPPSQLQGQTPVSQERLPVGSYLPLYHVEMPPRNSRYIRLADTGQGSGIRPFMYYLPWPLVPYMCYLPSPLVPPGQQLMNPRASPPSPRPTQLSPPPNALQEDSSDNNGEAPKEDVSPPPEPYIWASRPLQNIECLLSNNIYKIKGQVKCPSCQSTYDINLGMHV